MQVAATVDALSITMENIGMHAIDGSDSSLEGSDRSISNDDVNIALSSILRSVEGVAVATRTSVDDVMVVQNFLCTLTHNGYCCAEFNNSTLHINYVDGDWPYAPGFYKWYRAIQRGQIREDLRHIAVLSLIISFLRLKSHHKDAIPVQPEDLAFIWNKTYDDMMATMHGRPLCSVTRSAQGFMSVAICSIIKDGDIDELWRFHVWLPDGQRGNSQGGIHSHQPYSQSWILAGQGTDHSYHVERVDGSLPATHAEYAVNWNDGKNTSATYTTNQNFSVVKNTGQLVRATLKESEVHTRNMTYTMAQGAYHRSDVPTDMFHATLFFFDSSRGFLKDARVLGPAEGESFIQYREAAGITASKLAQMVEVVRSWEILVEEGHSYYRHAEWEDAVRAYRDALDLCDSLEAYPYATHYRQEVLANLSKANERVCNKGQADL